MTRALTPAVQALDASNKAVRPVARRADADRPRQGPAVRPRLPPAGPRSPARRHEPRQALPEFQRSAKSLNRFFNLASYNKNGREAPGKAGRDEGYLFWLAWTTHQGANLINVDDANGPMRPVLLTGLCSTLTALVTAEPALEFAMGLSPLLATACGNPDTPSIDLNKVIKIPGVNLPNVPLPTTGDLPAGLTDLTGALTGPAAKARSAKGKG